MFDQPGVRVIDRNGPTFQVQKRLDDGQTLTAQVDRANATVRQYQMADVSGGYPILPHAGRLPEFQRDRLANAFDRAERARAN